MAPHTNTWNRSEPRSGADRGAFHPGWLHKSPLDGWWLVWSHLGQLLNLCAAATETPWTAGQLGHQAQLPSPRSAPQGNHAGRRWQQIQPRSPTTQGRACARPRAGCSLDMLFSGASSKGPPLPSHASFASRDGFTAGTSTQCCSCPPLPRLFRNQPPTPERSLEGTLPG